MLQFRFETWTKKAVGRHDGNTEMEWIYLPQNRVKWYVTVNKVMKFWASMKCRELIDSGLLVMQKDSTPSC